MGRYTDILIEQEQCDTYGHLAFQRPPAQGWGIVSDVATPIHSVG